MLVRQASQFRDELVGGYDQTHIADHRLQNDAGNAVSLQGKEIA